MRLRKALCASTLALASCRAATAPPLDLERMRTEGRVREQPPVHPLVWTTTGPNGGVPFVWGGDQADVAFTHARVLFVSMPRLVVHATDPRGRRTEFVLDTGTTWTSISTASPLAEDVSVWEGSRVASRGSAAGRIAVLPVLQLGGLTGRDVEVAVVPRPHDLGKPGNLIGQDLLRGLLLRHRAGRWTLLRRSPEAAAADRPAFIVPLLAPGLPMVRVRDPSGAPRFALIDTGAPMDIPTARTSGGRWQLEGFPNALPLQAPEGTTDATAHLRVRDWPISLLIGLRSLSAADWVLDLEAGEWRFLAPSADGAR
ncbi:MAG: retroviral-like aspartic protease family protein [Planctomycetia bacterium]|nr:retroviral-like aspartic protease family protein [Planctomycetia bacterium]